MSQGVCLKSRSKFIREVCEDRFCVIKISISTSWGIKCGYTGNIFTCYISMLFPMNVGVLFSTTPPLYEIERGKEKKKTNIKLVFVIQETKLFFDYSFLHRQVWDSVWCTSRMKHPNERMRLDANKYGNNPVASLSVDCIQVCNSV